MALTDDEFQEEYKPLHVPAHYQAADTLQNKMIFALAEIGEGTADDVIQELERREPGITEKRNRIFVKTNLQMLYENGHLTGAEQGGVTYYNLNKITRENRGSV